MDNSWADFGQIGKVFGQMGKLVLQKKVNKFNHLNDASVAESVDALDLKATYFISFL